jgi:hypothetical protein
MGAPVPEYPALTMGASPVTSWAMLRMKKIDIDGLKRAYAG